MIKAWHIFIFSFIPLALVFVGVIGGSYRGADADAEVFPTAAATAPPRAQTPSPGGGGATVLEIAAKDLLFDKRTLTAPANTAITIRFDNKDAGVQHNVAIYRDRTARTKIFVGELFPGPAVREYKFTTPGPGSYFFRCDVHPDTMTGTFTVR